VKQLKYHTNFSGYVKHMTDWLYLVKIGWMLTTALVSGWLEVMHIYSHYFLLSLYSKNAKRVHCENLTRKSRQQLDKFVPVSVLVPIFDILSPSCACHCRSLCGLADLASLLFGSLSRPTCSQPLFQHNSQNPQSNMRQHKHMAEKIWRK